jgi:outer membrane receptor protein involved in Fe transport
LRGSAICPTWLAFAAAALVPWGAATAAEDPPGTPVAATDAATVEVAEGEEPAGLHGDEIVVTAGRTEQRVEDVPVAVTLLGLEELEVSAARATDDFLRQVPSFNSQRPGSSRSQDPANSGVTFRGLGGNASSRALVLVDGVPLNEPFAGWVAWSRVPLATVERIEVVPGAAAGAWGSQALGGVIHVLTRRPSPGAFAADLRYGSRQTLDGTLMGSDVRGPLSFSAHASYGDSDGHYEVPAVWRGPVDEPLGLRSTVGDARLEYATSEASRWTLQGTYMLDERRAGNALSGDELELFSTRIAGERTLEGGATVRAQLFGVAREAWSRRAIANGDRTELVPRRDQFDNPSRTVGADVAWSHPFFASDHLLTVGTDVQWTDSALHEHSAWTGEQWGQQFDSEGKQLLAGLYVQDNAILGSRWRLNAGGRVDLWEASDGTFLGTNLVTGAVPYDVRYDDRSEVVFSPNLGVRYDAGDRVDLRAAAYQGFRAPTPNELLKSTPSNRSFIAANGDLEPERVDLGLEAGIDWTLTAALLVRGTGFWTDVSDAILDVTVGEAGSEPEVIEPCGRLAPRGICNQRQNVERLLARGVEAEVESRFARSWRLWASYTYTDSRIVESSVDESIEGNFVRRIPEHQGTARLTWSSDRVFDAAIQVRYQGERYEDNSNRFLIPDVWITDLRLNRPVGRGFELMLTVENLFDVDAYVGQNEDFRELGAPRTILGGFVWRSSGAAR